MHLRISDQVDVLITIVGEFCSAIFRLSSVESLFKYDYISVPKGPDSNRQETEFKKIYSKCKHLSENHNGGYIRTRMYKVTIV